MASRKGLGRGLSALIPPPAPVTPPPEPAASEANDAASAPLYIAISRIAPNPGQPRKVFRESELSTLAASIREQGVLQPLVVRRRGDGYELIIGERRWRAAQLAGLDEVPAVILDATDRQVVEMALVENVQRADLNPMELAEAFRVLIDDEGMTQDEAGRRVGLDRSSVANHLRLLELPTEIQQDLIDQRLTMGHAKAILQVPASQRMMVRDQVIRTGLSVRAAEELGRRAASTAPRHPRPGPVRDLHVADLEERLRKAMQTKVRIIGRRARGRIELHYFGEGELDRLSERLLGEIT
jgi:ParB family transcriptional regulator, chromosome partitioning protein